jgi:hypothetical protein
MHSDALRRAVLGADEVAEGLPKIAAVSSAALINGDPLPLFVEAEHSIGRLPAPPRGHAD